MKSLAELRKEHEALVYKGYRWEVKENALHLSWEFLLKPDIIFRPDLRIEGVSARMAKRLGEEALNTFAFHLGLAEIPSYWKAALPQRIEIEAGFLDKKQLKWWRTLLTEGLGEFFYQNKIDFTKKNFLDIAVVSRKRHQSAKIRKGRGVLVPVGGGKDAVVTLELLKESEPRIFLLNPTREQLEIARIAKAGEPIVAKRTIDPTLLELNRQGYLNGHTPFSAYLAFLSVFVAALFEIPTVAISQERSSNEGNAAYKGKTVNHQWSKTYAFETMFRKYAKDHLTPSIDYFSFLRPLYELQIAKLFVRHPKYFKAVLSCNEAHKTFSGTREPSGGWCCKCSKCLFVFLSLYPFVPEKKLIEMFGSNLFEDKSLAPLLRELLGEKPVKPFECVGTRKEVAAALRLSVEAAGKGLPPLLEAFKDSLRVKRARPQEILRAWNTQHFLPSRFARKLKAVS